ncbi:MAG: hypothetical protein PHC61_01380 [Chitinivibrionales bacterium]|nr:hypothetical protein [Chitinivibrionales bacterium]
MKNLILSGLTILVVTLNLWAIDGIAVTVRNPVHPFQGNHWDGDLYRIDITGDNIAKTTKLVSGMASQARISPNGKRVAFVQNGYICVMSIDGGTITQLCKCFAHSMLDFPTNDWIYWANGTDGVLGGYPDSSSYIYRVNATSGSREFVMELLSLSGGVPQLKGEGLSLDTGLTRLCVHNESGGGGSYIVYFFSWNTNKMRAGYMLAGCGGGMSFDGQYLYNGHPDHASYDIVKINFPGGFADSSLNGNSAVCKTGALDTFVQCGNTHFPTFYGAGGATNSADWITRCRDAVPEINYQDGQCLFNWRTGKQIITGPGDAGDFWVGSATQTAATMVLNPATLSFAADKGSASPAAQTVQITNSGIGTLNTVTTSISYTSGSGWLTVGSPSGSGNTQTLSNTISLGSLNIGTYAATVTVTCGNAQPTSATYTVALQVTDPALTFANLIVTPAKCTTSTWSPITFAALATSVGGAGLVPQPTFKWTIEGGQSIDSTSGLFSAATTAGGPYTVTATATSKGVTKSATATVLVYRPVTITAPLQAATYKIGDTLTISWTRLANTTTTGLDIELTTDQGLNWSSLVESVLIHDGNAAYYQGNVGTLKWKIPLSFIGPTGNTINCASNKCMVRLNAPYDNIKLTKDVTGVFTIASTAVINRPGANLMSSDRSGKNAVVLMYDIRGRKIANLNNAHSGVLIEQISGQDGARLIVNTERRNRLP